jgi:hypothetical protein
MGSGYVFIACIAVFAYGLQQPLIRLAKIIGVFPVVIAGVMISSISILFFGLSSSFGFILLF